MLKSDKGNDAAYCPKCDHKLNGFAQICGTEGAHPHEGSLTICAYCRSALVFNADLTLRFANDIEKADLKAALRYGNDSIQRQD